MLRRLISWVLRDRRRRSGRPSLPEHHREIAGRLFGLARRRWRWRGNRRGVRRRWRSGAGILSEHQCELARGLFWCRRRWRHGRRGRSSRPHGGGSRRCATEKLSEFARTLLLRCGGRRRGLRRGRRFCCGRRGGRAEQIGELARRDRRRGGLSRNSRRGRCRLRERLWRCFRFLLSRGKRRPLRQPGRQPVEFRQGPRDHIGLAVEFACVDEPALVFIAQLRDLVEEPLHLAFIGLSLKVDQQFVAEAHVDASKRLELVNFDTLEQLVS